MFEAQESIPWYRSLLALVLGSLLLPPLGMVLLLMRRDTGNQQKIAGSLCIAALGVGYLYLILGHPFSHRHETQYAALEQHRAQQREQAPTEAPAAPNNAEQPRAPSGTPQLVATNSTNQPTAPTATGQKTDGGKADSVTIAEQAHVVAEAQTSAAKVPAPKALRNYWTNFRGPGRDGRYDELEIKTKWSPEGLPLLWRQPVGVGYSSFVVADGMAFTIEQRRRQEVVAAYNVETGRELWTQGWNAEYTDQTGDGPRSTPTWDDGRLYAMGATGEFRCLEAKTGKVIWSHNILSENGAQNLPWGMAASPLIVDDKVIVLPGGPSGKSVVAYNKLTGTPIWKALDDKQAYTSPMLVTLAGKRQVLVVSANRIVGLAPEDGSLLWEYPWSTEYGINVSQPIIVDKNRFFISAGYGHGAALVAISGSGKNFTAQKVWENISMKNKFNSSVLYNGYIYGLDEGILTCLDVATGERKWKGGRYGYGQVLLASGHLIVSTDTGELVLVKATPEQHTEVARFSALQGKTWNVPAIAGGRLLVRNANEMACYNLSAQ